MSLGSGRMDWSDDGDGNLSVDVTRSDTYRMVIGRGKMKTLPELACQIMEGNSACIVTDENVGGLLLQRTADLLATNGIDVETIVIPAGEPSKSWPGAQSVNEEQQERGAKQQTKPKAIGGGVT